MTSCTGKKCICGKLSLHHYITYLFSTYNYETVKQLFLKPLSHISLYCPKDSLFHELKIHALNHFSTQRVAVPGIALTRVLDLALHFELQKVGIGAPLKRVKVLLDSIPLW